MFSDRYRPVKIAGLILALVFLGWLSNRQTRRLTFAECLRDPERYSGAEVIIYQEPRLIKINEHRLVVSNPEGPIEIRIPPGFAGVVPPGARLTDLKPGDSLEAVTVFRRPGDLELKAIRGSPLRGLKVMVSIVPVIFVGIFLFRSIGREGSFLVVRGGLNLRESSQPQSRRRNS